MATLDVDAQREVAKEILRYCGVPKKDLERKLIGWGKSDLSRESDLIIVLKSRRRQRR